MSWKIISASEICCIPLRCVGIVQGKLIYRRSAALVQTRLWSIYIGMLASAHK